MPIIHRNAQINPNKLPHPEGNSQLEQGGKWLYDKKYLLMGTGMAVEPGKVRNLYQLGGIGINCEE